MNTCEMLHCCGFFNKYEHSKIIDCRGFIDVYCKGTKMNECSRLAFFRKHDQIPPDDMSPSGKIIECDEHFQPYGQNSQQYF